MQLIEQHTPICPFIVADSVVLTYIVDNKLTDKIDCSEARELSDYLAERADEHFNNNPHFRKQIKRAGNKGRDNLYMFMNHWLEAKLTTKFK